VALHPSGLYVVVGFSDKLRLMNLLIDDIRTFREFAVRACREVNVMYIYLDDLYSIAAASDCVFVLYIKDC